MADISIGLQKVTGDAGSAGVGNIVAGEAVSMFDLLYLSSADQKLYKADDTTAEKAAAIYIALQAASTDDYVVVKEIEEGGYLETDSAFFTADTIYCVSSNAGKIAPFADKTTGEYLRIIGWAKSTTQLHLFTFGGGVTVA